jgi:hypothetical protein
MQWELDEEKTLKRKLNERWQDNEKKIRGG